MNTRQWTTPFVGEKAAQSKAQAAGTLQVDTVLSLDVQRSDQDGARGANAEGKTKEELGLVPVKAEKGYEKSTAEPGNTVHHLINRLEEHVPFLPVTFRFSFFLQIFSVVHPFLSVPSAFAAFLPSVFRIGS